MHKSMTSRSKAKSAPPKCTDEVPLLSQPSSDDGMAAALIQKLHSTSEKRRKEKETRYLATYKKEMLEIATFSNRQNAHSALEFNDYCDQINKAFDDFLMAYAKAEDEIRATWVKIIKAHEPFTAYIRESLTEEVQLEQEREDQQILGVAYHKKSEESLNEIIADLLETDTE